MKKTLYTLVIGTAFIVSGCASLPMCKLGCNTAYLICIANAEKVAEEKKLAVDMDNDSGNNKLKQHLDVAQGLVDDKDKCQVALKVCLDFCEINHGGGDRPAE